MRVGWGLAGTTPRVDSPSLDIDLFELDNRDALAAAKAPTQEDIACQTVGAWHDSGSEADDTPRSTSSKRSARSARSGRYKLRRGNTSRLRKVRMEACVAGKACCFAR